MPNTMNVLITGGGRGIGRATAILAGSQGWNVGINYLRDEKSALEVQEEINSRKSGPGEITSGKAVIIQGDVCNEKDVSALFDRMSEEFHSVPNAIVINAGATAPTVPLTEISTERLHYILDTNLFSAYFCAREAARRWSLHPPPPPPSSTPIDGSDQSFNRSIVFVSSLAAKLGSPNEYVDYAGAKGAVDTLTTGLAKELGPQGIRVNCVRPGHIRTDIHALTGDPGRCERYGSQCPLGRPGEAREVAEAIVWLLSDKASYVTGAHLDVTGGR